MDDGRPVAEPARGFLSHQIIFVHGVVLAVIGVGLGAWLLIQPPW